MSELLNLGTPTRSDRSLEAQLEQRIQSARMAWPSVSLSTDRFHDHLVQRFGDAIDAALQNHYLGDLYLVCACIEGDPHALSVFEAQLTAAAQPSLVKLGLSREQRDDTLQQVREKLFVGQGGAPPKLASYAGTGPLPSWLRAVSVRTALSHLRSERAREREQGMILFSLPSPTGQPEFEYLRRQLAVPLKNAFSRAILDLEPRQRLLLRRHFLDGLDADELAALYRVHVRTIFRWLRDVREALIERARRRLTDDLHVSADEMGSLMRLLRSRFDVSVARLLR
jgi:RNA polymerase sigma-70 factor (ECF subfamily)